MPCLWCPMGPRLHDTGEGPFRWVVFGPRCALHISTSRFRIIGPCTCFSPYRPFEQHIPAKYGDYHTKWVVGIKVGVTMRKFASVNSTYREVALIRSIPDTTTLPHFPRARRARKARGGGGGWGWVLGVGAPRTPLFKRLGQIFF